MPVSHNILYIMTELQFYPVNNLKRHPYPTSIAGNGRTSNVGPSLEPSCCSDSDILVSWFDLLSLVSSTLEQSVPLDSVNSQEPLH